MTTPQEARAPGIAFSDRVAEVFLAVHGPASDAVMDSLRLAAAQAYADLLERQSQPVAWVAGIECNARGFIDCMAWSEGEFTTPLYAAPAPALPPLTDDEIRDLVRECGLDWQRGFVVDNESNRYEELASAIERRVRGEA